MQVNQVMVYADNTEKPKIEDKQTIYAIIYKKQHPRHDADQNRDWLTTFEFCV